MEHLGRYLKRQLQNKGIYIRKVAELSGSNLKTLFRRFENDHVTANELMTISDLINVDAEEIKASVNVKKEFTNDFLAQDLLLFSELVGIDMDELRKAYNRNRSESLEESHV